MHLHRRAVYDNNAAKAALQTRNQGTFRQFVKDDLQLVWDGVTTFMKTAKVQSGTEGEEKYLVAIETQTAYLFLEHMRCLVYKPDAKGDPKENANLVFPVAGGGHAVPSWNGKTLPQGAFVPPWYWSMQQTSLGSDGHFNLMWNATPIASKVGLQKQSSEMHAAPSMLWPRALKENRRKLSQSDFIRGKFPVLFFTPQQWEEYWPPAGRPASEIFTQSPKTQFGASAPAVNYLSHYPVAIVTPERILQDSGKVAVFPAISAFHGSLSYAYNASDPTVLGTTKPAGWGKYLPCPWSSESNNFVFDGGPAFNACGLYDVWAVVNNQMMGNLIPNIPKKYGYPEPAGGLDEGKFETYESDYTAELVALLTAQGGGIFVNGAPPPKTTKWNASWLGVGNDLIATGDFLEVTPELDQGPYGQVIRSSTMARYHVDTTRPRLSMSASQPNWAGEGVISWYPIVKVEGDVNDLVVSCDSHSPRGEPRRPDYMASLHYDLRGRKGIYDLLLIIIHQHRMLKGTPGYSPPDIPQYLTSFLDTVPPSFTSNTLESILDAIIETDSSGNPLRWSEWGPFKNNSAARYNIYHRLPDLDYLRILGRDSAAWSLQAIEVHDYAFPFFAAAAMQCLQHYVEFYAGPKNIQDALTSAVNSASTLVSGEATASNQATWISSFSLGCRVLWPTRLISTHPVANQENIQVTCRVFGDYARISDPARRFVEANIQFQIDNSSSMVVRYDTKALVISKEAAPSEIAPFYAASLSIVGGHEFVAPDPTPTWVTTSWGVLQGHFGKDGSGKDICVKPITALHKHPQLYHIWYTTLDRLTDWVTVGIPPALQKSTRAQIKNIRRCVFEKRTFERLQHAQSFYIEAARPVVEEGKHGLQ